VAQGYGNQSGENNPMKKLIFLSSGRCGTKRIAQILSEKLPGQRYAVVHQMRWSRLANVVGNMMYYFGNSEKIKAILYAFIISRYESGKSFVSTDPLTAMIVPSRYADSPDVCLVHLSRDDTAFADSMFSLSRARLKSLIAHNLVPFWQPCIWPGENLFNKNIGKKYEKICALKNEFFITQYSHSPNYHRINMSDVFSTNILQQLTNEWFNEKIVIWPADLERKSNESTPSLF
jgi:hypothetical protein